MWYIYYNGWSSIGVIVLTKVHSLRKHSHSVLYNPMGFDKWPILCIHHQSMQNTCTELNIPFPHIYSSFPLSSQSLVTTDIFPLIFLLSLYIWLFWNSGMSYSGIIQRVSFSQLTLSLSKYPFRISPMYFLAWQLILSWNNIPSHQYTSICLFILLVLEICIVPSLGSHFIILLINIYFHFLDT